MRGTKPPRLAQRWLQNLLLADQEDAILGDLEELYHQQRAKQGALSAWRAYWAETLRSAPALALRKLRRPHDWLILTSGQALLRPSWATGLLSLVALIPISIHLIPWWMAIFFVRFGVDYDPGIGYDLLLKPLIYDHNLGHLVLNLKLSLGGFGVAIVLNLLGLVGASVRDASKGTRLKIEYKRHLFPLFLIGGQLLFATPWIRYMFWINSQ